VNIIGFSSHEEMQAYLIQAQADADAALHPAQRAITWGSHWVRFEDIAHRLVIFGRVLGQREVYDAEIEAGATVDEAEYAMVETTHQLEEANRVYSICSSIYCADGEYGTTHKAALWPIEESLYNDAAEADWNIDRLPLSSKINLQAAFTAYRGRDH
jgi:hypothetical protein